MANTQSAKKRIGKTAKRQLRNKMIKSSTKTAIKKVAAAVSSGDKDAVRTAYFKAVSAIDKASAKGVFHKNNAARKVSNLTKLINK
ncbi:MAG: 30S ribosomal protein S20 [Defluviitaleaceae bacterium]|nr:30S ribosomal protein S20 [Defluviitaleaceae bacterium]